MGKKANPAAYLDTYRAELDLLDRVLRDGPLALRFAERGKAISARHRLYKARAADRARVQAEDPMGSSPYDTVRVKAPTLTADGLHWRMELTIAKGAADIDGLLELEDIK